MKVDGLVKADEVWDIVVCSDERHILRLILVNLEKQGWNVRTAMSGSECLSATRSQRPDLIVLNVNLPDMSGYEVAEILDKDPTTSGIRILFMSDKGSEPPEDGPGSSSGVRMHISKPFNLKEILSFLT